MHSLLARQIKRCFGNPDSIPAPCREFIQAVEQAYGQFDDDREMLERSLELSSDELLNANAELRALLSAIPDLFFRLDAEGIITYQKAGSSKDLVISEQQLLGKRLQDIPLADVGDLFRNALEQVKKTGEMVNVVYLLDIGGQQQAYEARLLPLMQQQSMVIIRNMTEKMKLEEEILKGQKLESIGILAGGIAHDFNNILSAILGNISLAKLECPAGSKIFQRLERAENASYQARKLTQQLLTFAKGGAPIRKTDHLDELLRDTVEFVLSGSNVNFVLDIDANLAPVEIDRGQINQVLNNLIINAVQAMPDGGTIHIQARNIHLFADCAEPLAPGEYVRISVRDQGVGIAKEQLALIFDPYFTTKAQGSGLGLATSYSIIQKHDGHISASSVPGKGATFTFYLPTSERQFQEAGGTSGLPQFEVTGRILLMDDEPAILRINQELLEMLGFETVCVADGLEAIRAYQEALRQKRPFDAVIMDLTVPGGAGGKEAIGGLLKIDPEVKAIVSSGYSQNEVLANYASFGFQAVLSKPFKLEELALTLYRLLNRAPYCPLESAS
jgi:signal transduction histidine kinase/CheY-like chemotaxis protein